MVKAPASIKTTILFLALAFGFIHGQTLEEKYPTSEGWIRLWNGVDLKDWEGDPKVWSIDAQNGAIFGGGVPTTTTFMWYKPRTFSDFVLEAKVWLKDGQGNAGIQFRSKVFDAKTWVVAGYQADLGQTYWCSLYDEHERDSTLALPSQACLNSIVRDGWNQYVITANGNKLKSEFNGNVCWEYTDTSPKWQKFDGIIALQVHDPGTDVKVRYKDIFIKPTDGSVALAAPSQKVRQPDRPAKWIGFVPLGDQIFGVSGRRIATKRISAPLLFPQ